MRILVLFGGESVEHEISIITANQVMNALKINYTVIPVYISKKNKLYYLKNLNDLDIYKNINKITKKKNEIRICKKGKINFIKKKGLKTKIYFDMAFPLVHGKGMEDSTLLSYLKFNKIPTIADSLSFFSIAQNKCLTKRVMNALKISNVDFVELTRQEDLENLNLKKYPLIVKPNTLGSSIGIKKVNNEEELKNAVSEAFKYDKKIIIEEFLENNKEYNISVTEKDSEIIVSDIEEIVKGNEVLNYKQKYEGNEKIKGIVSTKRIFPVKIDGKLKEEIEDTAKKIYKHFEAKGVIRIDFLYKDKLYVNEINSIPGSYAFYLWSGKLDFVELLDIVIESSKKDVFRENKLIKSIDKMYIFDKYNSNSSGLKK